LLSVASCREIGENALEPLQVFDLAADVGDVLLGKTLDLSASEFVRSGKTETRTDLIEGEAELPTAADEVQPL
jgi:hypothetical protein